MGSRPNLRSPNNVFFQDIFVKVIFFISTFIGIFPCRYENGQFFASIPLCIWSFLMVCLTSFSTVYFNINLFIPETRVKFLIINTLTQILVSLWFCLCFWVFYLVTVMNSVQRMRHINRILLALNELDRQLAISETRRNRRQRVIYFAKAYFGGLVFAALYYFNSPLISLIVFLKVPLFLPFFCVWLSSVQFTSLADLINLRLDETCVALNGVVLSRHFSISNQKLISLSQIQNQLCDVCVILDSSFGWLITCVISVCFNGVFIPFFILLPTFFPAETGFNINVFGLAACWIVISLYSVWQIVSTTSGITRKVSQSKLIKSTLAKFDNKTKRTTTFKYYLCFGYSHEYTPELGKY